MNGQSCGETLLKCWGEWTRRETEAIQAADWPRLQTYQEAKREWQARVAQSSACSLTNAYGQCLAQQETYACTTQTIQEGCAQESVQVICPGSPSGIRCLDPNDCADTTAVPSTDMALAASHIASLNPHRRRESLLQPPALFTFPQDLLAVVIQCRSQPPPHAP